MGFLIGAIILVQRELWPNTSYLISYRKMAEVDVLPTVFFRMWVSFSFAPFGEECITFFLPPVVVVTSTPHHIAALLSISNFGIRGPR